MSSIINISGTLNTCYIFYVRMADCVRREPFYDLMCRDQFEDYEECRQRTRYVIIFNLSAVSKHGTPTKATN